MKLYDHQKKLIEQAPDKHLLAWGCGSGKTLTALRLAGAVPTLVVCPKSIVEQWEHVIIDRIVENSAVPIGSVYGIPCLVDEGYSFTHVTSKETFKKLAPTLPKYDCLIIDEAHFFFGMTGARKMSGMLKALLGYIKKHNPKKIYLLTATPYMSSPLNIYACAKILGRDWSYSVFHNTFFNMVNMGMRFPIPVVKKGIEPAIAKMVNSLGSTVKLEDCFDVPEQTFLTEYFYLTKEQKDAIAGLEDEGIARWTKTHQICGGTMKRDGYTENKVFKSEKMDRVLELAKEHKKLIIVCRYNHEIEALREKIERTNRKNFVINGKVRDRHDIVGLAERESDCVVLIQAQCSEGYELPSFPVMIFYSYDFSLKNAVQMRGRILRSNKLKKNVYLSLVVKGTIDNDIYRCIMKKEDFQIKIYEKKRRANR